MPSSISSSELKPALAPTRIGLDRLTMLLLATALVVLAVAEFVTSAGFDRKSKVQVREVGQRRELLKVRDAALDVDPHVAVLGNSLMLDGVDESLLAQKLAPDYNPVCYFVLGTEYVDWYFALKRLFAEGMRPRYVVLGLSPNQLASFYTRGDYSARYLFRARDLVDAARSAHMDPTTASGFVLAHFSEYYSTREVTRGFLMSRLIPQVSELLHSKLGTTKAPDLDEQTLRSLSQGRLRALNKLCQANGANFILVIPPSYQKGAAIIREVGLAEDVTVLEPVAGRDFDATDYQSDGFHMNEKGSELFTARLADELAKTLSR